MSDASGPPRNVACKPIDPTSKCHGSISDQACSPSERSNRSSFRHLRHRLSPDDRHGPRFTRAVRWTSPNDTHLVLESGQIPPGLATQEAANRADYRPFISRASSKPRRYGFHEYSIDAGPMSVSSSSRPTRRGPRSLRPAASALPKSRESVKEYLGLSPPSSAPSPKTRRRALMRRMVNIFNK